MHTLIKRIAKAIGPIRREVSRRQMATGVKGQSDEAAILRALVDEIDAPRTFVEIGFHPTEFNCASLLDDHEGLLIDGDGRNVTDALELLPNTVRSERRFLTRDNLDIVRGAFDRLGVLSIDVDGNDYWLLKELLPLKPAIIVVEYNASFLGHCVTTPYDPAFDRSKAHPTGWYHGASLTALTRLVAQEGYGLTAVSEAGGNAFFTLSGDLDPVEAWRPSRLRDEWAQCSAEEQWAVICDMPLVQV